MPHKAAAYMLVSSLLFSALVLINSAQADSPKIASTSLCGDSYLLALAPDHISHLSWQSRDRLSTASEDQKRLPQAWDDKEYLISVETDIVLFGPGEGYAATDLFAGQDIETINLVWGENFETVESNIKLISTAITPKNDTDDFLEDLASRLSDLRERAEKRGGQPRILYLSRAGGVAGPGTYVDAVIQAAGAQNAVDQQGWFTPDPETLMSYQPDIILTSFFEQGYESINSNGLRHSAVQRFIDQYPRIDVPGHLWPCAGPGLIDAAELIADKLDNIPNIR